MLGVGPKTQLGVWSLKRAGLNKQKNLLICLMVGCHVPDYL